MLQKKIPIDHRETKNKQIKKQNGFLASHSYQNQATFQKNVSGLCRIDYCDPDPFPGGKQKISPNPFRHTSMRPEKWRGGVEDEPDLRPPEQVREEVHAGEHHRLLAALEPHPRCRDERHVWGLPLNERPAVGDARKVTADDNTPPEQFICMCMNTVSIMTMLAT